MNGPWQAYWLLNLLAPILAISTYLLLGLCRRGLSSSPGQRAIRVLWAAALVIAVFAPSLWATQAMNALPTQVWDTTSQIVESGVQQVLPGAVSKASTTALNHPATQVLAYLPLCLLSLICLMAARLIWQSWHLEKRLRDGVSVKSLKRVCITVVDDLAIPLAFWRPGRSWVAMPSHMLSGSKISQQLAVKHELQHHRQGDTKTVYFWEFLRVLFFWNPFIHKAIDHTLDFYELTCDEQITNKGVNLKSYALCLLTLAEQHCSLPRLATGMKRSSTLQWRVEAMIHRQKSKKQSLALAGLMALTLTIMGLTSVVASEAETAALSLEEVQKLAATSQDADFPIFVDQNVTDRLNQFLTDPASYSFMKSALEKKARYEKQISEDLIAAQMPTELLAVPLIESGYENMPAASSGNSAAPGPRGAGLWMFIASTARAYNLVVDDNVDERLDVGKETAAAIDLLSDLHGNTSDWGLSLAGYNQGIGALRAAMAAGEGQDALELAESGHLNGYVASVMAGVLIIKNPELMEK